jgi:hypothetical protein
MRSAIYMIIVACLFTACEKIPPPLQKPFNISIYDLKGQKINEASAGLHIKIVDEKFREINKQIDLRQEGFIIFDKIAVPIMEAKDDFIITAVPLMGYPEVRSLNLQIRIRNQYTLLCQVCIFYRPTVRGTILTGFSGGASDGTFQNPAEMTLDAAGNIYVIDQRPSNDVVLKVTPTGTVTTFAGAANEFGRLVGIGINNVLNRMYVSDATAQRVLSIDMLAPSSVTTLAGSGTAGNADGTGTAASFKFGNQGVDNFGTSETGQGLTVDADGNIYVGEKYGTSSSASQIRKITPAGVVTTLTGSRIEPMAQEEVAQPAGVAAITGSDLYYVSGSSGFFQGITRINAGVISRAAGRISYEGLNDGSGAGAQFSYPKAVAGNAASLYVADGTNGALRRMTISSGRVITLAGVGHFNTNRFSGSGMFLPPLEGSYVMPSIFIVPPADYFETAAAAIRMDQAGGVAVRNDGLIYVADYGYKCIWKITIG